jgi:hypothetical protein
MQAGDRPPVPGRLLQPVPPAYLTRSAEHSPHIRDFAPCFFRPLSEDKTLLFTPGALPTFKAKATSPGVYGV